MYCLYRKHGDYSQIKGINQQEKDVKTSSFDPPLMQHLLRCSGALARPSYKPVIYKCFIMIGNYAALMKINLKRYFDQMGLMYRISVNYQG